MVAAEGELGDESADSDDGDVGTWSAVGDAPTNVSSTSAGDVLAIAPLEAEGRVDRR